MNHVINLDEPKDFFIHFFLDREPGKQDMGSFVGAFGSEGIMLPEVSAIKSKNSYLSSSQPVQVYGEEKNTFWYFEKLKFRGDIAEMIREAWKNHFHLCNLIPDPDRKGSYLLLPPSHQEAIKKAYQEKIRGVKEDDPFYKCTAEFRLQLIKITPWSVKAG